MVAKSDFLIKEYEEINRHLRSNIHQFVNWFSFFLTFSFIAVGIFVVSIRYPAFFGLGLRYPVLIVFLLMHVLAFVAILTFRRYISTSNQRVQDIIRNIGEECLSPIPVRFCKWMTDLMAAGFVISYFTWFLLLFIR